MTFVVIGALRVNIRSDDSYQTVLTHIKLSDQDSQC